MHQGFTEVWHSHVVCVRQVKMIRLLHDIAANTLCALRIIESQREWLYKTVYFEISGSASNIHRFRIMFFKQVVNKGYDSGFWGVRSV